MTNVYAVTDEDEITPTDPEVVTPPAEEAPDPFEARIAQLEQYHTMTQQQVSQLTAAVGRAQSLADKFEKTGDPKVEDKVRAAMAEVYDVLGTVSENIDDAILPAAAKARVASAREAVRKVAEQAEIDRRIAEAVGAVAPPPVQPNANAEYARTVEAQVVSEITAKGLNPDDPAFNWQHAATLLHGAGGQPAMWEYMRGQIAALAGTDDGATLRRRPRVSPPPAAPANNAGPLDASRSLEEHNAFLRSNGII